MMQKIQGLLDYFFFGISKRLIGVFFNYNILLYSLVASPTMFLWVILRLQCRTSWGTLAKLYQSIIEYHPTSFCCVWDYGSSTDTNAQKYGCQNTRWKLLVNLALLGTYLGLRIPLEILSKLEMPQDNFYRREEELNAGIAVILHLKKPDVRILLSLNIRDLTSRF